MAIVEVRVRNGLGTEAVGRGSTILSVPWSWPGSELDVETRDSVLRDVTREFTALAKSAEDVDPIAWWRAAEEKLLSVATEVASEHNVEETVPDLAAMLALGAVDSALPDAWSRAAGRPAHTMYGADHLSEDLSGLFGEEFTGVWPGEFLQPARDSLEAPTPCRSQRPPNGR